jgi:ABC-type multidrug transport system ATPase subunit
MNFITAQNIHKSYGTVQALTGISFSVEKNELFGFIGPDGAGKTSLFRIIATLLLPTKGTLSINSWDVVKDYRTIRKNIGYMPGRFSLYQDLSVEENLNFFATIFNTTVEQNYDLIKDIYVQIEPFKERKAGKLSGGMKQKLALSCALIHRPSVLFLDEPTTGVDAVSRKEFWEMLKGLKKQGITILVSTPYMDEAGLCDRVALIQNGKILSINTPQGIVEDFSKPLWAVKSSRMLSLLNELLQKDFVEDVYPFGEYHHAVMKRGYDSEELVRNLKNEVNDEIDLHVIQPDIEDCFIALMTENAEAHGK